MKAIMQDMRERGTRFPLRCRWNFHRWEPQPDAKQADVARCKDCGLQRVDERGVSGKVERHYFCCERGLHHDQRVTLRDDDMSISISFCRRCDHGLAGAREAAARHKAEMEKKRGKTT
jgi:hypothetical protein